MPAVRRTGKCMFIPLWGGSSSSSLMTLEGGVRRGMRLECVCVAMILPPVACRGMDRCWRFDFRWIFMDLWCVGLADLISPLDVILVVVHWRRCGEEL